MASFADCPDIRIAVPSDEDEIMRLMRLACEEDAQHPINEDKVRAVVALHFNKQGAMVGVIGDEGKELKAYILMVVNSIWYSDEWQVNELSLFVAPDHRRSTYARQLMSFSKQVSEALKLDLMIGVLSTQRTEAKVRLYQRQFPQAGAYFLYHPSNQ